MLMLVDFDAVAEKVELLSMVGDGITDTFKLLEEDTLVLLLVSGPDIALLGLMVVVIVDVVFIMLTDEVGLSLRQTALHPLPKPIIRPDRWDKCHWGAPRPVGVFSLPSSLH